MGHLDDKLAAPLIVTLQLDAAAQAYFDALRQAYFPPARLWVGAHVTMFHALPGACEPDVAAAIARACAAQPIFTVSLKGLRFLGRGVAYDLHAPEAHLLRAGLASRFAAQLTRQDSARWSPHITIQNKVDPATARQTMMHLHERSYPDPMTATGMALWRYQGGPWQIIEAFRFQNAT